MRLTHNSSAGGNLAYQWSIAPQPVTESWMQLEHQVFLQTLASHPAIHCVQSYAFENVHHLFLSSLAYILCMHV